MSCSQHLVTTLCIRSDVVYELRLSRRGYCIFAQQSPSPPGVQVSMVLYSPSFFASEFLHPLGKRGGGGGMRDHDADSLHLPVSGVLFVDDCKVIVVLY